MNADKMTLREHAEAWWRESGKSVLPRSTPEWDAMYAAWVEFAFADMGK